MKISTLIQRLQAIQAEQSMAMSMLSALLATSCRMT